jgi:hypothetical protein
VEEQITVFTDNAVHIPAVPHVCSVPRDVTPSLIRLEARNVAQEFVRGVAGRRVSTRSISYYTMLHNRPIQRVSHDESIVVPSSNEYLLDSLRIRNQHQHMR